MNPNVKPFVKWAGGKRQLLEYLIPIIPDDYKTYYEPFVGGGALLFDLQPSHNILRLLPLEHLGAYQYVFLI